MLAFSEAKRQRHTRPMRHSENITVLTSNQLNETNFLHKTIAGRLLRALIAVLASLGALLAIVTVRG